MASHRQKLWSRPTKQRVPIEPRFEDSLVERMELDFPVEMLEPLLFLLARMTDTLLERVK
jgi:protein ImuB